jgi:hypothetical protein
MPIVAPLQSDFSGGEISALASGRVDHDRYKTCVELMLNWVATLQGPPVRRPGTVYVAPVKTPARGVRLMEFVFSNTQAYVLEIGHLYTRFYTQEGQLLRVANITAITKAASAVVTSANHAFVLGTVVTFAGVTGMTDINGLSGTITAVTTNTFTVNINSTGFAAYIAGGTATGIFEITTPWTSALISTAIPPTNAVSEVDELYFAQKGDTLYIVHPNYQPRAIIRQSNGTFTMNKVLLRDGPYLDEQVETPGGSPGSITLTLSAVGAGLRTVTASSALFVATDVGRLIRFRGTALWTYMQIQTFTSSTSVDAVLVSAADSAGPSTHWRLGLFSDTTGWPACLTFHEGRLVFAGSRAAPQSVAGSVPGDYENMKPTEADGSIVATDAYSFDVAQGTMNQIVWMVSNQKGLELGTVADELLLTPGASADAISPLSVFARRHSGCGSAAVQPKIIGRSTLFVQQAGKKINDLEFYYQLDGFDAEDITLVNDTITQSGVKILAHTKEPYPILWAVRNDGVLIGCTYKRAVNAVHAAWHRHVIGGRSTSQGDPAIVRSIAAIPTRTAPPGNGAQDELWLVVQRKINGAVVQYVEYMAPFYEKGNFTLPVNAMLLDSLGTRPGSGTGGFRIVGATQANPCVITVDHNGSFLAGTLVVIDGVIGMTQLNGQIFKVKTTVAFGTAVTLTDTNDVDLDSTNFSPLQGGPPGSQAGFLFQRDTGVAAVGSYLEGETITVLGDAGVQADLVVTAGVATLNVDAGFQTWGFAYNSDLKLLRIDAGGFNGTSVGKTQGIHRSAVQYADTIGLKVGYDFDHLAVVNPPPAGLPSSLGAPIATGISTVQPTTNKSLNEHVCIRADTPLPATVLIVAPQLETYDRT